MARSAKSRASGSSATRRRRISRQFRTLATGLRTSCASCAISRAAAESLSLWTSSAWRIPSRACLSSSAAPMAEGSVGAGTGATVAKLGGPERAVKGGIGSAAITLATGHTVAAAVAVNAVGGIWDYANGQVVAGPRRAGGGFDDSVAMLLNDESHGPAGPVNTTIGLVATDARISKEDANYLARLSHDGLAMVIRPCHTIRDGDTMFALATGHKQSPADLTALGAAAVEATAQAVLRAVRQATGLGGIPSISELKASS